MLNHGIIGNERILALVSPDQSIDWLCMPSFDSPSVFGRILDDEKGGRFQIVNATQGNDLKYVENTNVLRATWQNADHGYELFDFAPRIVRGLSIESPPEIVRILRPLKGRPQLRVVFDPRPDYGRANPEFSLHGETVVVTGSDLKFYLYSNLPMNALLQGNEFVLDREIYFVFSCYRRDAHPNVAEVNYLLDSTIQGWRAWAKTCSLPTFEPQAVLRSALCLKLHTYKDTGAIIAAATTSIPEALGTERTWDYRYCWLRDAAFVVEALRRLSHLTEGEAFIRYLRNVVEAGPIQPLYSIHGNANLEEGFLPHLAGYKNNGFVRIGNAAYAQRQNDLMGEVILCLETFITDPRIILDDEASIFPLVERLVEEAIVSAPENDTGIWEFRSMLRPYSFSRAMCWVAIQRGSVLARRLGKENHALRWEKIAEQEREIVLRRAYNQNLGFFTQALDGQYPDASNLLFPTIGIIDARDPRFVSTVRKYEELLMKRGLLLRYRNEDDFGETTSAFTICSFWWCEALALMGELDQAIELFRRMKRYANPLGLYSEDVDPSTGELLGNFPQAYTHVGLIHTAMTIGELLEAREGRARAWT
ncbi:MAG: glycoside hydrolase family 15 protein [Leptospirales bacterium]|nr:glycoside hydrolase family 15 protein [Leptospirales bacterium]